MPAKAGTQGNKRRAFGTWTPAFAGATMGSIREASVWFRPLTVFNSPVSASHHLIPCKPVLPCRLIDVDVWVRAWCGSLPAI